MVDHAQMMRVLLVASNVNAHLASLGRDVNQVIVNAIFLSLKGRESKLSW